MLPPRLARFVLVSLVRSSSLFLEGLKVLNRQIQYKGKKYKKPKRIRCLNGLFISPVVPFRALWAAYYQFNSAALSFHPRLLFLSVTIDSLYKVTEGGQSDVFHRHGDSSYDPACCFTVYHGNHMESLDLVASNAEEARTWVTGLRYLMAGISDEDSLAKRQRTHDQYPLTPAGLTALFKFMEIGQVKLSSWIHTIFLNVRFGTWLKQTFEEADKNGDGFLNIEEIYQLLHKLNVNLPRRKVKQMFQVKLESSYFWFLLSAPNCPQHFDVTKESGRYNQI